MATSRELTMQAVVKELQNVHRLSERDAASIALTVSGVVEMRLSTRHGGSTKRCPFFDPEFTVEGLLDPCPVCGMLGTEDAEYKCVD